MTGKNSVVGVDLGGTNIRAGRVKEGRIEKIIEVLTPDNPQTAQETIDKLINTIQAAFTEDIQAIGIGVPSVVDRKKGIVYNVVNIPHWDEIPLKEILEKHFAVPVCVDNDANCFALGERCYGAGMDFENFVGLTLGTGLGGGIIQQGNLLDDANCGSGEFGMIPYKDQILEYYCSGSFFQNIYQVNGKEMYRRAQNGDPYALEAYEQLGYHIAQAIQIVMYTLDPEMIILGGSVAAAHPYFEDWMWHHLKQFAYPKSVERLQIRFSKLQNSGILGAAAIALSKSN
ncbi:ROK family protein [Bacteroides graminisolvens]|uniref:ROK family protein n=1 Tax=Bacteroides graminisolvens TaxID=477666 RepID=UPI0030C73D31